MGANNNKLVIQDRRQKIWTLLTRGMKGYEIAKELNTTPATISRDIQHLTSQSQNFLNDLAKETLPFMYKSCIDGIREVLKECWKIYESTDEQVSYFQRLAALKLAKECNEAQFKLLSEGPSIMYVQMLEDKLAQIEESAAQSQQQQQQQQYNNQIISR
jgi:IS30 family transposase